MSSLHLFAGCSLVAERDCEDQWGRRLECWPWSASWPAWLEVRANKSVICTVMEGLKGGPYCLLWQELLSCELLAILSAGILYSEHRHHSNYAGQAGPGLYPTHAVSLEENMFSLARKSMVFAFCCDTLRSFSLWASFFTESILHTNKHVYFICTYGVRCTHVCLIRSTMSFYQSTTVANAAIFGTFLLPDTGIFLKSEYVLYTVCLFLTDVHETLILVEIVFI